MRAFTEPLTQLQGYEELEQAVQKTEGVILVSGCIDAVKPHIVYSVHNGSGNRIIVTFHEQKAKELLEEYRFFDKNVAYYPAKDILFYQSDIRGNVLTSERINALKMMAEEKECTIITTFDGLMNPMPAPEKFIQAVKKISVGDTVELNGLTRHLVELGYEKNYQAETMGEFSVRGGIIDIFPLTEETPFRIELWGDEVDSIRSFDPESQRSIENLEEIYIYPACELVLTEEERRNGVAKIQKEAEKAAEKFRKEMKTEEAYRVKSMADQIAEETMEYGITAGLDAYLSYFCEERVSLLDYLKKEDSIVFLDETVRTIERGQSTETEFSESMKQRLEKGYILPGQMRELFSCKEILAQINQRRCVAMVALDMKCNQLNIKDRIAIESRTVNPYNNSFELLVKDLKRYKKNGYRMILLSSSRTRAKRLAEDLMNEELPAFYSEDFDRVLSPGEIMTGYGKVKKGYEYPAVKFVVISESDIFGSEKKKKKRHRMYEGEKIASFTDLNIGDYVVHENHGLGIYRGIEKIEVDKTVKDYIKIEYAGGGNLYILATQLELIQKYAGADAKKPKLNKLGGQEWNKTKTKVRGAVKEIAGDLVRLYAVRQSERGFAYGPDTVWQREFEEMFPFEETEDQDLAIEATKKDMESTKIMDRLICGDVGFGKTEVAIRAAFKAVSDNKQVAVLVPTTVLAFQHFQTFSERLKDFPCRIEYISRARTTAQIKHILKDVKEGAVNILIGTHRIVSKDVVFKDLGLLIIDEEQKFGVSVKEKLRQLKTNVDTLTMTATPIPRTLQFSLMGARDLSSITTPPPNRYPVQTEVERFNPDIIREAINFEMSRNGQVFFINNRIQNIYEIEALVKREVPDARVCVAHGQMEPEELEKKILDFVNYEYDVLVATSIIESGIDVPNANTIIINNAQQFGLSDLHQLRGRVGRSNRKAFCYLLSPPLSSLTQEARRRLQAIESFSELGSGIHIAMQDLDIRGAGNMLGAEQSGFIADLGYETYQKILSEAVRELKTDEFADLYADELKGDGTISGEQFVDECQVESDLELLLPAAYVTGSSERMLLYCELDGLTLDKDVDAFRVRLEDRFGPIPPETEELLRIVPLRRLAARLGTEKVFLKGSRMTLFFVSNLDSPYYQSLAFGKIIAYMMKYTRRCDLREQNGKRSMVVKDITTVEEAVAVLQEIVAMQVEE